VAPDPGPVASGRRAIHAHVDADRSQRFRRRSGAAVVAICEQNHYIFYHISILR